MTDRQTITMHATAARNMAGDAPVTEMVLSYAVADILDYDGWVYPDWVIGSIVAAANLDAENWQVFLSGDEVEVTRYGDLPQHGRSYNAVTSAYEHGVSIITDKTRAGYETWGRPLRTYRGVILNSRGGDNEPLAIITSS